MTASPAEKILMTTRAVTTGAKLIVAIVRTAIDKPAELDSAAHDFTDSIVALMIAMEK